jgi:type VI secretion system protein ImpG
MRDELSVYYEDELNYLRQMGAQFAEKYPDAAGRLVLGPTGKSADPHVERLLEGFAFLAARVRLKLDEDFPEITEALLDIVYPHFVRPIPSMSIVQFQLDQAQGKLTTGLPIPADSMLYSRPVGGIPCKFRTCYDTTLWPLTVTAAEWKTPGQLRPAVVAPDAAFALRVEIQSAPDLPIPKLGPDHLRFHLFADGPLPHVLYEALCSRVVRVLLRDPGAGAKGQTATLPASCVRPVGFEENEAMIRYPRRSFQGYRLLQEYFAIPEKFLFVELTGLAPAWNPAWKNRAELIFLICNVEGEDRRQTIERHIAPSALRLNCVPVINLFPQTAEPVLLDERKPEYPVTPDIRRSAAMEVFSVEEVSSIDTRTQQIVTYRPFYSFRNDAADQQGQAFWVARRRPSMLLEDSGTDVYLSMVDGSMRSRHPDAASLTVRTICTNRNLPARLPFGNELGDFEMELAAPIRRIVALRKPTKPLRPPQDRMALWHLISHFSLNYLSLVEEGREAFQGLLRLYDFVDDNASAKMIEGLAALRSRPHFARLMSDNGIAYFARGKRVEIELDEEQFAGRGVYLFASVVEQFLAQYASLNSFTQLVATTRQRKEALREWPPRAGRRILI